MVRIFTPAVELPFAGHPLVGTAWLLAREREPVESLRPPAGEARGTEGERAGRSRHAPRGVSTKSLKLRVRSVRSASITRRPIWRGLAPPLPLGEPDAHPSDHAAAVASATPERSDVVVVAQSLGAFAGPLAAERVGAALLVLLAPMIPAPGETAGEWWQNTGHAEAIADLLERHGSMSDWGADALDEAFLHDVDPDVVRAAERFNGAPGPGMFTEPWPHAGWPDVTTRILCPREDRLFPWKFQKRVAGERLGLGLDEIRGGHLPMLSRPAELAQRLAELAAEQPS